MERALAVIGANDFQDRLIRRARALGYVTHVFAWEQGAVGRASADHFYPISITEKEEILKICRGLRLCGVVSVASDLAVPTVNFLAARLGLPGNAEADTAVCTNKYRMRARFLERGLPTPRFWLADETFAPPPDAVFPLIVKPTDRSGSRGVTLARDERALKEAVRRCIGCSFEKKAIVEAYIEGEEFSAESISFEGRHRLLAVTQKFTTNAPHFIETGHLQPARTPCSRQRVEEAVYRALDALGVRCGASHAEFRITPQGEVRFIEVGARMGGDCIGSDLVPLSTGYDFLKMTIDTACGRPPDFTQTGGPSPAFVRFVFTEADLATLAQVRREWPDVLVRASAMEVPGTRAVTDSSTRFGYYVGACADEDRLAAVLRRVF